MLNFKYKENIFGRKQKMKEETLKKDEKKKEDIKKYITNLIKEINSLRALRLVVKYLEQVRKCENQ